jgi:hypothetical protein
MKARAQRVVAQRMSAARTIMEGIANVTTHAKSMAVVVMIT